MTEEQIESIERMTGLLFSGKDKSISFIPVRKE